MEYVLFFKDAPVASIEFSDNGIFERVNGFYNKQLLPVGMRVSDDVIDSRFLSWAESRFVPATRSRLARILKESESIKTDQLFCKTYGLSLTDCYWVKPRNKIDLPPFWDQVNYFDNEFSPYVGDLIFFDNSESKQNFLSPDLTLNGNVDKRWVMNDENAILCKKGNPHLDFFDSFNELIASFLADALEIPRANTGIAIMDGEIYTTFANFIDEKHAMFSALSLSLEKNTVGKAGVLKFIKEHNLKNDLDKILILDYLMMNTNRALTNLSFIQGTTSYEALEQITLAPVYGFSNCLWIDWKKNGFDTPDDAKPFETSHERQIMLVDNFSCVNFSKIEAAEYFIKDIYNAYDANKVAASKIIEGFKGRIEKLANIIELKNKEKNEIKKEVVVKESEKPKPNVSITRASKGGFDD